MARVPSAVIVDVIPRSRRPRERRIQRTVLVGRVATEPDDRDVAEVAGLVELDQALLVQLEHGEEAHDDLEPLDQRAGELAERDAPDARQLVEQLLDRVGDAGPDRGDVVEVDARHRLRRDRPQEGGAQVVGGDAGEQVGRELEEAVLQAGGARVGAAGLGRPGAAARRRRP